MASGGGTRNPVLMSNLREALVGVAFRPLDEFGVAEASKEALAFALIGYLTGSGLNGSVPSCTGAGRATILGCITPGKLPLRIPTGVRAPSGLVVHSAKSRRAGALRPGGGDARSLDARRADRFAPQAKGPRDRSGGRPRRPARREGRRRRRERVGQDAHDAFGAPAPAETTPDPGRSDRFRGRESDRSRRAGDRDDARRRGRDGLPGPDDLAEPAVASAYPGRRDAARPRLRRGTLPASATREVSVRSGFADPERVEAAYPARALGRDAPAGDDRDGACHLAAAAGRRRADHRPRRHDPAADPRPRRVGCRPRPAWRSSGSPTTSASSRSSSTGCP